MTHSADNPGAPKTLRILERRAQALQLRIQGGSYRKIAATMRKLALDNPERAASLELTDKYNEAQARRDILAALKKLQEKQDRAADQLRTLELERLDSLWAMLYPKAEKGDYAAFDRLLGIMSQREHYVPLRVAAQVDVTSGGEKLPSAAPVIVYLPDNERDDRDPTAAGTADPLPGD